MVSIFGTVIIREDIGLGVLESTANRLNDVAMRIDYRAAIVDTGVPAAKPQAGNRIARGVLQFQDLG